MQYGHNYNIIHNSHLVFLNIFATGWEKLILHITYFNPFKILLKRWMRASLLVLGIRDFSTLYSTLSLLIRTHSISHWVWIVLVLLILKNRKVSRRRRMQRMMHIFFSHQRILYHPFMLKEELIRWILQ